MKQVNGEEVKKYFQEAINVAKQAKCQRAKCGAVIVKNGKVIGKGYNAPPLEDETQRTCNEVWDYEKKPKYDLTCCIHAEWNAILDACKNNADKTSGSALYFMRVDNEGNFTNAGEPYCTVCSRLALQSGIKYFVLWNAGMAEIYETREYNKKSYEYFRLNKVLPS